MMILNESGFNKEDRYTLHLIEMCQKGIITPEECLDSIKTEIKLREALKKMDERYEKIVKKFDKNHLKDLLESNPDYAIEFEKGKANESWNNWANKYDDYEKTHKKD